MNTMQALLAVQYDRNWEVWAKAPESDSEARFVESTEWTAVLEAQGYIYITNGEEIGQYVMEYCEDVLEEDRPDFAREAIERFLEEIREEIASEAAARHCEAILKESLQ